MAHGAVEGALSPALEVGESIELGGGDFEEGGECARSCHGGDWPGGGPHHGRLLGGVNP